MKYPHTDVAGLVWTMIVFYLWLALVLLTGC